MLMWALAFFGVAIVAAVLGFTGIAATASHIAVIISYVFLVLSLISAALHWIGVGVKKIP